MRESIKLCFLTCLLWLMNHFAVLTHKLSGLSLTHKTSHEAKSLVKPQSRKANVSVLNHGSSNVVSGMVLMLLGGLFLNLSFMLDSPLLLLPAMCAAVIVAIRTLFGLSRSRENTQARPKDASLYDVDSSQEP